MGSVSTYANRASAEGLPDALKQYLSTDQFDDTLRLLRQGQPITRVTDRHVVKVRTGAHPYYLNTLDNERRFYALGLSLPVGLPVVVFEDFTAARGVLVLEKVSAKPLARKRECHNLVESSQAAILELIARLQLTAIPAGWACTHDRNDRVVQHRQAIASSGHPLAADVLPVLDAAAGRLRGRGRTPALSHGDLNPMNILRAGDSFWFVDWEYAAVRPASYDPTAFTLFANDPREGVSRLAALGSRWDIAELFEDAFVLAARQVKNWLTEGPGGALARRRAAVWAEALSLLVRPGRLDLG